MPSIPAAHRSRLCLKRLVLALVSLRAPLLLKPSLLWLALSLACLGGVTCRVEELPLLQTFCFFNFANIFYIHKQNYITHQRKAHNWKSIICLLDTLTNAKGLQRALVFWMHIWSDLDPHIFFRGKAFNPRQAIILIDVVLVKKLMAHKVGKVIRKNYSTLATMTGRGDASGWGRFWETHQWRTTTENHWGGSIACQIFFYPDRVRQCPVIITITWIKRCKSAIESFKYGLRCNGEEGGTLHRFCG